ncbi:MAG: hypothetical protein WKF84_02825 [Pyrinomonadaceae bacterium]
MMLDQQASAQSGSVPRAQTTATAQDEQEQIRITTEEVRLPDFALDEHGHFDPTLTL